MASLDIVVYPYDPHFSLSRARSEILEQIDADVGLQTSFQMVIVLLFSNHITEAHTLLLALTSYSSECAVTTRKNVPFRRMYHPFLPHRFASLSEYFFEAHPDLSRPLEESVNTATPYGLNAQWAMYDQLCNNNYCRRLDGLDANINQDPIDFHQWRQTDDPSILAACCAGLSKPSAQGVYPSIARMKEALLVAQKLYAQPQAQFSGLTQQDRLHRHSSRIPRSLAVELAIRTGDLQAAADVLELAANLDGLSSQVGPHRYLEIPGIYTVLPLLAEKGSQGNPYFVSKVDATLIVKELTGAMKTRIEKGPQCPLRDVGWLELMDRLAVGAWKVNSKSYKKNQGLQSARDILSPPATEAEILAVEQQIGELPSDFKDMVRVSNGFKGDWHFLAGGMSGISCMGLEPIQFMDMLGEFGLEIDNTTNWRNCNMLQIAPGATSDNYTHYLVPPSTWKTISAHPVEEGEYLYFTWSTWSFLNNVSSSVRDFIVGNVKDVERMVRMGYKETGGLEDDSEDDSSNETENAQNVGQDESQITDGDG